MNNFTYRSAQERENIEAILRQRRRKVNRQQIVSAIILIGVVGTLLAYFAFHVYYTEFDGYVRVDSNQVRSPFNIYLDSVYVKTGDIVAPGDTMYSYYNMDLLTEGLSPHWQPAYISQNRDLALKLQNATREIEVLKVQAAELRKQIAVEDHNISFGLSSNSHKMDLERELKETMARMSALAGDLAVIRKLQSETTPQVKGDFYRTHSNIYDNKPNPESNDILHYYLASDSLIITEVMAPDRMIFFERETILKTQHLDLEGNNLGVVAYVPVEKMKYIDRDSEAKIVVSGDLSYAAHVEVLGTRTEMIPENLRSYFSKKNTAIIALFKIDEGQTMPFWALTNGLPVSVRISNIDKWRKRNEPHNYLQYTTGKGLKVPDSEVKKTPVKATKSKAKALEKKPSATTTHEKAHDLRYFVVVSSFKSESNAEKALAPLKAKYPQSGKINNGKRWLIYSGGYATEAEASEALKNVRREKNCSEAWIYHRSPENGGGN